MANVAVIGAQWGDEGKGKIVDWLSARADVVVRFQGGHNAGHTLVIDGVTYKLSLLPSGVVRPGKLSVIGNGVVIDPWALIEEIEQIKAKGVSVTPENLVVAENAALILPVHRELDRFRETSNSGTRIGTTGRGIGPAYEDKVGRRAIRVIDLKDPRRCRRRSSGCSRTTMRCGAVSGVEEVDADELTRALAEIAPKVLPYAAPVWRRLEAARKAGRRVLFEGAQGALLDIDHGTYPYVTSSNTVAGQAAAGSGCGPRDIGFVLGIAKAYTTRVGEGPFPTELNDEIGERIGRTGAEFGTVTGRKRRCGWFDAVLVRQTVATGGIDGIALTKLDVLDGFDEVKVCTGYTLGRAHARLPAARRQRAGAHRARLRDRFPAGANRPGARGPGRSCRRRAIKYIRRVEELIGAPVALLSTSPEREDTILVRDPFVDR